MAHQDPIDQRFQRYLETEDPEALGDVFDQAAPELLAMARSRGLDPAGAEDALQETFLVMIRRRRDFKEGHRVMPWAAGILARQVRSARRRRAKLARQLPLDAATTQPARGVVEADLGATELRTRLEAAIAGMPINQGEAVRAALFEGVGASELGLRLGITADNAAARISRGLKRLRRAIPLGSALGLSAVLSPPARGQDAVRRTVLEAARHGVPGETISMLAVLAMVLVPVAAISGWMLQGGDVDPAAPATQQAGLENGSEGEMLVDVRGERVEEELGDGPPPPKTYPGQLQAEDGRSARAGIPIYVLTAEPEVELPSEPLEPVAFTDAEGNFELPESALEVDPTPVVIARDGEYQAWQMFPETQLRLERGCSLLVRIVDENGAPVAGVEGAALNFVGRFLVITDPRAMERGFYHAKPYRHLFGGVSDANGHLRIDGLIAYPEGVIDGILSLWREGYGTHISSVFWDSAGIKELEVTLHSVPSLSMTGQVVDWDGGPLAGVELRCAIRGDLPDDDAVVATSGPDGSFSLPNEYLSEFPLRVELSLDGYVTSAIESMQPAGMSRGESFRVRLAQATPLDVSVVDHLGDAVQDLELYLASSSAVRSERTDAEGQARFTGLASNVGVLHVLGAHEDGTPVRHVVAVPNHRDPLAIRLPDPGPRASLVRVHLQDARTGGPRAATRVSLQAIDVEGFTGMYPDLSIENGVAVARNLPAGRWMLFASAGEGRYTARPVRIEATDLPIDVRATVDTHGVIRANLHRPEGAPDGPVRMTASLLGVTDAPVWFRIADEFVRTEVSESTGPVDQFDLIKLAPGEWDVIFAGDGWSTEVTRVTVTAGAVSEVELIGGAAAQLQVAVPNLPRPGTFEFDVLDPATDRWITLHKNHAFQAIDGPHVVHLPEGDWAWRARLTGDFAGGQPVDLFPRVEGRLSVAAGEERALDLAAHVR